MAAGRDLPRQIPWRRTTAKSSTYSPPGQGTSERTVGSSAGTCRFFQFCGVRKRKQEALLTISRRPASTLRSLPPGITATSKRFSRRNGACVRPFEQRKKTSQHGHWRRRTACYVEVDRDHLGNASDDGVA